MKVTIIGDYASISRRIGTELAKKGYEIEYFLQDNKFANLPKSYYKLGSVQGPLLFNYVRTGFWFTVGRIFKKTDIQLVNGTYPKCVRASNTCFYYNGSDLRLGSTKPQYPSFVSLRELLDYSKESIFLQRAIDPELFYPIEDIKEKKEVYKDNNGIDYIIGHFAHSPKIKGSAKFQQAISNIVEEEGLNIEFRNKPIPRKQMLETMNFCDFIFDHINPATGKTYNVVSLESLLCEVPVGTYYEDKYFDFEGMKNMVHYIDPQPEETEKTILNLLRKKSKINREDVIKYHGPETVVDVLESYWKEWEFI
ncbi:MAG: hypothetical protein ACTSQC_05995 [Candidatus Heimdallarchaeaceae archaeon]